MSRIDRAMELWEKRGSGAVSPAFGLEGYGREEGETPPSSPASSRRTIPDASADVRPRAAVPPFVVTPQVTPDMEARLVTGGSGAVPVEQYRRLAAVLHDVQQQQGLKTLMLTSALPGEGKTLTTVNLGLTLSASYERRVLIIDADLRWPSIHKMFGVANDTGLSEALQSNHSELMLKQVSPRLSVLTAGRPDVTPLAGLTSTRMASLVEQCSNEFDWVLIDTPPVGLLPDAQVLARLIRAVVFVIAAGATPSTAVQRAIAELGSDCIIGTVLNRVDQRRIPDAGYYSRYGYGYDESRDA